MTSKTSFPERWQEFCRIYRWSLKKNIGMMALLTVLLFIGLPMILMIRLPSAVQNLKTMSDMTDARRLEELARTYTNFLHVAVPVFAVSLLLLFALVLCIRLFSYMQNKRSVDLFHALPVGRIPMLLGHWCAGLTVMFVPVLLNFSILELIAGAYHISPDLNGTLRPAVMMLWLFLMTAAAFTFCLLMAVCSGSTMDTVLSILGVNVGYPLFIWVIIYLIEHTLPGVSLGIQNHFEILTLFSPFVAAYLPFEGVKIWFVSWWLFLTAVILAGSCLLYQRRRSEAAEDQFAFPIPKVIIRFLLTAVGGVGLGLLFTNMGASLAGFLIGVLIGSIVIHVSIEAIYSRGFRHLKKTIGWYAAFIGLFAVFYGVISTGCFGYDTWIPNVSEVNSVTIDTGTANYYDGSRYIFHETQRNQIQKINPILSSPDSIKTVTEVHKNVLSFYRSDGFPYVPQPTSGNSFTLIYKMKDGRTMQRAFQYAGYYNRNYAAYGKELDKITELSEFQQGNDVVFYIDPTDIKDIALNESYDSKTVVPDDSAKKELLDALKQNYAKNFLNDAKDSNKKSIRVEYKDSIEPNSRMKQLLGSYNGKICIYSGEYRYESGDVVDQLIQKMGWDK